MTAPHDAYEQRPRYERAVFDRWGAGAAATVVFSDYVAEAVADAPRYRRHAGPHGAADQRSRSGAGAGAGARRGPADFVLMGRLNPYKNIDVVLDAWQAHVDGTQLAR